MDTMPGMQMEPAQPSQSPDTHATMTLQEPENPERKTGSNLPAPELLKDVSAQTWRQARAAPQHLRQQKQSDQIEVQEQTYRAHGDVQQAFYDALTAQATVQPTPAIAWRGTRCGGDSPSARQRRSGRCARHPANGSRN
jgi:hypothetical protein